MQYTHLFTNNICSFFFVQYLCNWWLRIGIIKIIVILIYTVLRNGYYNIHEKIAQLSLFLLFRRFVRDHSRCHGNTSTMMEFVAHNTTITQYLNNLYRIHIRVFKRLFIFSFSIKRPCSVLYVILSASSIVTHFLWRHSSVPSSQLHMGISWA